MNKQRVRIMSVILALALAWGAFTPVQAAPRPGSFMSRTTVNLAYFYKPPTNSDAATVANNFHAVILTGSDEAFRDQLIARGFNNTVLEYFGAVGIQNPGSCTATPRMNQAAFRPGDFCSISQNHPDWFLLDANGQRILASPGSDTYRMDPGNSGWRNFFLTRVLDYQAQRGWSGLFLDNLEASLADMQRYGQTPARYPNDASYQAAQRGFLEYLKTNYGQPYNRPLFANIISRRDEASWFNYLPYLDGAMQESWAVDWALNVYVSEAKWRSDLALAERTQTQGKQIILVSQGNQTDANRQQFAYASYLLIANGKAAFRYSAEANYRQVALYSNYQIDLGPPRGPRYQTGTSWRRDFTRGYVVVNPVNHTATISTGASPTATTSPTRVATRTATNIVPTPTRAQPTSTPIRPTATQIRPTATLIQPTATPMRPTRTAVPPTSSPTVFPTRTLIPPTATVPPPTPTAGKATATQVTNPAAGGTFDDKNGLFVYSAGWTSISATEAYGGSHRQTTRNGATVTFPFAGQSFSILYKGGIHFSKFDVYVDGTRVATLNQNLPGPAFQQRWDFAGSLNPGNHTLKLVFLLTSSEIDRGSLDAVIVR